MSEHDNPASEATSEPASETPAPANETQPQSAGAASAAGSPPPGIEERQWALFAHLSALIGFIIPFGNLLGPLVIWQIKKEQLPFSADQAKEALNFQITVTIAVIACFVLTLLLIGFVLLPIVGIGALILTVIAAVKANSGEAYRYPFTLRLIN